MRGLLQQLWHFVTLQWIPNTPVVHREWKPGEYEDWLSQF